MVERVINIARCPALLRGDATPYIERVAREIDMIYLLRFLLYCDQCHDFLEKLERNKWVRNRDDVYNTLKNKYSQDITYINRQIRKASKNADTVAAAAETVGARSAATKHAHAMRMDVKLEQQLVDEGIGPSSTDLAVESSDMTKKLTELIDKAIYNKLSIIKKSATGNLGKNPCSRGGERMLELINAVPGGKDLRANKTPYNLAVDADQNKMSLSSLLNLMCDKALTQNNDESKKTINIYDMASTKYDSASGSKAINFIKAIKENEENSSIDVSDIIEPTKVSLIWKPSHPHLVKFGLSYDAIELMVFKYVPQNDGDLIKSEYWVNQIKDIPNEKENRPEREYYPAATKDAYRYAINNNIIIPYTEGSSKYKDRDNWRYGRHTLPDMKRYEYRKTYMDLRISRFFGHEEVGHPMGFNQTNKLISRDNSSVAGITSTIKYNSDLSFNAMCYKTIGDFGQIIEYYSISKETKNKSRINLFFTFDEICSRISCLFNKYTIFESGSSDLIISPIVVFVPDYVEGGVTWLAEMKTKRNLDDRDLGAASLMSLANEEDMPDGAKRLRSEFGKKKKVSIMNTSTRVLKAKLKSVGIPLSKVIRGKRMKLTRKQLEMRAEAFKKLQMRCQKRGISLTYVSKKGRKYKSVKRLLNDMKRKPKTKTKPKTKKKSKMKWG